MTVTAELLPERQAMTSTGSDRPSRTTIKGLLRARLEALCPARQLVGSDFTLLGRASQALSGAKRAEINEALGCAKDCSDLTAKLIKLARGRREDGLSPQEAMDVLKGFPPKAVGASEGSAS